VIFSKKCIGGDTKSKEKVIVNSVGIKIFEKKFKKGVTKQGGNCDSQWWEMMFF
jgi:hypothetical protein